MKLKIHAQKLGIRKLDASSKEARVEFEEQPSVDPMTIIHLIQSSPQQFRLEGSSILKYIDTMETPGTKVSGNRDSAGQTGRLREDMTH